MKRFWTRLTQGFQHALLVSLIASLAYALGSQITGWFHGASASVGGLWSAISGIVVFQASPRESRSSAMLRVIGTGVGAVICALYLSYFTFTLWGMGATLLLTTWICRSTGIPDHARLASITAAVIMVTASTNPDLGGVLNAALRFGESCIGAAMAVLVSHVFGRWKRWHRAKADRSREPSSP